MPKRRRNSSWKFCVCNDLNEAKEIWRERDKQASELAKIGRASEEAMKTNIERVRDQMQMVGAAGRVRENN